MKLYSYIFLTVEISTCYWLKKLLKRSIISERPLSYTLECFSDCLGKDNTTFDWAKQKNFRNEYIRFQNIYSKFCLPVRKTNIFVIMGQTSHAIKHAQNPLKNIEKILVWVNMANIGLRILGNILKYGSGLNVLKYVFTYFLQKETHLFLWFM